MKEKAIPKKVKGTVLFTVVAVMMVLIVFLMGTLALAATANNRAMNSYNSAQTQATARAGVEAVIAAMQNDQAVANAVAGVKASNPSLAISGITFDDPALGRITDAKVEYAGTRTQVDTKGSSDPTDADYNANYGKLVSKDVIKISVTAEQGNATNTVSAYIVKDPSPATVNDGNSNGFVSTGGASMENHTSVFGGTYLGFDEAYKDPTYVPPTVPKFSLRNGETIETDLQVNGNFEINTSASLNLVMKEPGTGMTVWGNVDFWHSLNLKSVNATSTIFNNGNFSYTDVPYLYVDKTLTFHDNASIGQNNIPFNIYCGDMDTTSNNVYLYADVYCYDPAGTSTFNGGTSALYEWSAKVLDKDGNAGAAHTSGNYYTKGNLEINTTWSFAGDVVVEGTMKVNGNTTINGDLTVGDSLTISGGSLTVNGTLRCDSISGSYTAGDTQSLRTGTPQLKSDYEEVQEDCIFVKDYNLNNTGNKSGWMYPDYSAWVEEIDLNNNPDFCQDGWMQSTDSTTHTYTWFCNNHGGAKTGTIKTYSVYKNKTTGAVVSQSEATELVDASGNVVPMPVIFPAEYEKDVILGKKLLDGTAVQAGDPEPDSKIIKTVQDILNGKSDPYATQYKVPGTADDGSILPSTDAAACAANVFTLSGSDSNVQVSPTSAAAVVQRVSGTEVKITDSCTLTGSMQKGVIRIQPASNQSIWIKITGTLSLTNGAYFLINDSDGQTVNFLIDGELKQAGTDSMQNDGMGRRWITTTTFESELAAAQASTDKAIQIYTSESHKVPGVPAFSKVSVNIYSSIPGPGEKREINLGNEVTMIANIMAPYLDFNPVDTNDSSKLPIEKLYYNGYDVQQDSFAYKLGVIGCCVVRNFKQVNDWTLLYVPGTAGGGDTSDTLTDASMTAWGILYYENF